MDNIPIIFIHSGNQYYLNIAIQQAKKYDNNVILLGDDTNKNINVSHYIAKEYCNQANDFKQIYKSMTCNPHNFELLCFQRWFILNEFMTNHKLNKVFYLDSDVMLYYNITIEEQKFNKNYDAIFSIPKNQPEFRYCGCAHTSYWSNIGINKFCKYMMDVYNVNNDFEKLTKKWQYHLDHGKNGAVCDMTLLYLFSQIHGIQSITEVINDSTFDHNINNSENLMPNEYKMNRALKELKWIDDKPYCYNLIKNKWIRFNAIHLSSAEQYIESFIK